MCNAYACRFLGDLKKCWFSFWVSLYKQQKRWWEKPVSDVLCLRTPRLLTYTCHGQTPDMAMAMVPFTGFIMEPVITIPKYRKRSVHHGT